MDVWEYGPGWLSRYSDWIRAGRSGDRIPVGARFSALVQTGSGDTPNLLYRGSVRITRGLGATMNARGQSIGISIGMLPQTLIMSITVQKTSKYHTKEFDLEEGF